MPFTTVSQKYVSDLVVFEPETLLYREIIPVTIAAGATLTWGSVLFRAQGIDPTAAWDVVDAAGDVTAGNEYALYLGDRYDVRESLVVAAATSTPVLAIVKQARINETLVKAALVPTVLNQTQFNTLKEAFKRQHVIINDALAPIAP